MRVHPHHVSGGRQVFLLQGLPDLLLGPAKVSVLCAGDVQGVYTRNRATLKNGIGVEGVLEGLASIIRLRFGLSYF